MKMVMKNLVSIVLGLFVVSFLLLTGCATKEITNTNKTEKSTVTESNTEAPLKIRLVNRVNVEYFAENNPVLKEIERKANVSLEVEIPPIADYANRVGIMMASGDLPDILYIQGLNKDYAGYAENGLLIAIDDYIVKSSNIIKNTSKEQMEAARVSSTGKLHAIVKPHTANYLGMFIRQDWLDKLKLKVPTTPDEFLSVAKAFTDKDPDGNGKNDTFGFSISTDWKMLDQSITNAFGLLPNFIPNSNGKFLVEDKDLQTMDTLDFLRKAYEMKALDSEWYMNKSGAVNEKWKKGNIGIFTETAKLGDLYNASNEELKIAFSKAEISFIMPLKDKNGKITLYDKAPIWGGFAITKDCKDPVRTMKFIDYMFSDEGIALSNVGVQGVTYEKFDTKEGILIQTEAQQSKFLKYVSIFMTFIDGIDGSPIYNPGNTHEQRNIIKVALNFWKKSAELRFRPEDSSLPIITQLLKEHPDLYNQTLNMYLKYIIGQSTREQYKKFITDNVDSDTRATYKAMQKYYDTKLKVKKDFQD